jgi:multiple sugar transport system permease protein
MRNQIALRISANKILMRSLLLLGAIIMFFPFLWMVSSALKNGVEAFATPPTIWPHKPTGINFQRVSEFLDLKRLILNSVFVSAVATGLQLFTSGLAGFAFARIEFRGKKILFLLYLTTMMIPLQVVIVPLYLEMRTLNLIDSYPGLMLPMISSAFGVFLIRQAMFAIPRELEEAAILDGANLWRIFRNVAVPLTLPSFATLGILSFMSTWNSFLWPLIIISSPEKMTLPLGIASLYGEHNTDWPLVMAATSISVIPLVVVYIFLQKQITQSFLTTGIK